MRGAEADDALRDALADLLDGTLDSKSRRELNDRLKSDPEARQLYLEFCELHASLAWQHGCVLADFAPEASAHQTESAMNSASDHVSGRRLFDRDSDPDPDPDPDPGRSARQMAAIAALAAVILFGFFWWQTESSSPAADSGPIVAELVNRIDATVTRQGADWEGRELRVGRYQVQRGLIDLRFPNGVVVLVESPADFELRSDPRLVLFSGRLSADVPPEGIGFTVETPEAEVIDYGTEFSVEVSNGESEVHVFRGHVRVHPKKAKRRAAGEAVDLRTDQAIRINDATRRPAGIDLAKDRFIRSIEEPTHRYPDHVKSMGPVAYYRMPIRVRGLACAPARYRGEVLTGDGVRPACAPGIFGGSLRVGGRSIGRGAYVPESIPLSEEMSVAGWVYAESRPEMATIVTNGSVGRDGNLLSHGKAKRGGHAFADQTGRFLFGLDGQGGGLSAQVVGVTGEVRQCREPTPLILNQWHFIAFTIDGSDLSLYRDGALVAKTLLPAAMGQEAALVQEAAMVQEAEEPSLSPEDGLWIGTDRDGEHLWDGRIDELSFFDRALTDAELQALFDAADRPRT